MIPADSVPTKMRLPLVGSKVMACACEPSRPPAPKPKRPFAVTRLVSWLSTVQVCPPSVVFFMFPDPTSAAIIRNGLFGSTPNAASCNRKDPLPSL